MEDKKEKSMVSGRKQPKKTQGIADTVDKARCDVGPLVTVNFMRTSSTSFAADSGDAVASRREEQVIGRFPKVPPVVRYKGGPLGSQNIRLSPTFHAVPLKDIHPAPYAIEPDEVFVELYKEFILGRANAYYTRLDEKDIFAGFYRGDAQRTPVTQATPDEIIDLRCREIRSGRRPTVFLRENFEVAGAPRFFCCDSITSLTAYRRLGISRVPAAIVSRVVPSKLMHSAFEVRVARNLRDEQPRVAGFHPCEVESLLATRLDDQPLPVAIATLEERVEKVISMLRSFHLDAQETLHYHDALHSALVRTRDYLAGTRVLLNAGLASQAVSLCRSLYELHLNFYVDWLAPQNSWMEVAYAANADGGYVKAIERSLLESFSEGRPQNKAVELTKRALLLSRWLGVVKNKAMFAPVGIGLHDANYGYLSQVQHQDFRETAHHANRFRSEEYQAVDEARIGRLGELVNVVVTQTLELAESDIGGQELSNEQRIQ